LSTRSGVDMTTGWRGWWLRRGAIQPHRHSRPWTRRRTSSSARDQNTRLPLVTY